MRLIRFELYKQLKRKENLMILFMFALPLFYSMGVWSHSEIITYTSDELISGLSFADNMYTLVYMVFIIFLFLAINSATILKGEIENNSLSMMLTRVNKRSRIYYAKFYAQSFSWGIVSLAFVLFSVACYCLFLSKMAIATGTIVGENWLNNLLIMIGIGSFYILGISLVQCISMYFKSYVSVGVFILIYVIGLYLKSFTLFQPFVPVHYLDKLIDSGSIMDFLRFMALNWGLVYVFNWVGNRKFKRSDIGNEN